MEFLGKQERKVNVYCAGAPSLETRYCSHPILFIEVFPESVSWVSLQITILTLKCCKASPVRLVLNLTFS